MEHTESSHLECVIDLGELVDEVQAANVGEYVAGHQLRGERKQTGFSMRRLSIWH